MKAEPCMFFAKGHCARGSKCYYSHDTASSNALPAKGHQTGSWRLPSENKPQQQLRPDANTFIPASTVEQNVAGSLFVPCRFFAKGLCNNGEDCAYQHVLGPSAQHANSIAISPTSTSGNVLAVAVGSLNVDDGVCSKRLKGAEVTFGLGAQIARVDLHTDFSAIQISGLTVESRLESLRELLSGLGFPIPLDKFRSKTLPKGKVIVDIKMQDPEFAKKVVAKFNKEVGKGYGEEFEIKQIQVGLENNSISANRLQMSSVICSWFKASTTAWLHYSTAHAARGTERMLNQHGKILGRKLQIKVELPSFSRSRYSDRGKTYVKADSHAYKTSELHLDISHFYQKDSLVVMRDHLI